MESPGQGSHLERSVGCRPVAATRWLVIGWLCLCAGCSGRPSAVSAPSLSPEEAGRQALAEYDANRDGYLDAKELERCPALKDALKAVDKNGDKRISAEEIAERLSA